MSKQITLESSRLVAEAIERLGSADEFLWDVTITHLPQGDNSFGLVSMITVMLANPAQIGDYMLAPCPIPHPAALLDPKVIEEVITAAVTQLREMRSLKLNDSMPLVGSSRLIMP